MGSSVCTVRAERHGDSATGGVLAVVAAGEGTHGHGVVVTVVVRRRWRRRCRSCGQR